jgi:ATP adenylyltransferase
MSVYPFCAVARSRVVAECEVAIAIRDAFPVTDGHTLVVPRVHVKSIYDLNGHDQTAIWVFLAEVRVALKNELGIDALNIGINEGGPAGQTIDHAHVHLIPRREGDVADPKGGVVT